MGTDAPLRLGTRAKFQDRLEGRLVSFELDENSEVLNVFIRRGVLRWTSTVKLPLSAATGWSDAEITFGCASHQAFARELTPVAAPARPLSVNTPIGIPGAALVGAMVDTGRRVARELLVRHGGSDLRVPLADVSFEGKTIVVTAQPDVMAVYHADAWIAAALRAALADERLLAPEERRWVSTDVIDGVATLRGNVRTALARSRSEQAARNTPGVAAVRSELADDVSVETAAGRALDEAGVQRTARVFVRSALGEVTVSGHAPSEEAASEALRVVSRVPGVRRVKHRLEVRAALASSAG